nr:glycosyltransferase family 4 protein [Nocardioides marinus]
MTVALSQCASLSERGHEVTLLMGWDGEAPISAPGISIKRHRAFRVTRSFFGTISPGLLLRYRKLARSHDVVHLHYSRDLVQVALPRLTPGRTPLVLQAHGMIVRDQRRVARLMDRIFVRYAYARAIHLTLTEREELEIANISRGPQLIESIRNGVTMPATRARWRERPRVIFLARLAPRKRAPAFVEMVRILAQRGLDAEFAIYGPDEGDLPEVRRMIESLPSGLIDYVGPVSPPNVASVYTDSSIYVLPSVNEPFPMSLLEAMSHGLPSVITDQTGISAELEGSAGVVVTDGTPESMAEGVLKLLETERVWAVCSDAAINTVQQYFSVEAVADTLENVYQAATDGGVWG